MSAQQEIDQEQDQQAATPASSSSSQPQIAATTSTPSVSKPLNDGKHEPIPSIPRTSSDDQPKVNKRLNSFDMVTPYQQELQKRLPSAEFIVVLLSLLSLTTGLANTSFNPAILQVAEDYSVTANDIQAISSHYFMGLGVGQLLWGPLTDRFGRKKIVLIAGVLAVLINVIFISTQTYEQLTTARFFQGVIFSAFGLLPTAILRDMFSARDFVIYNSWVMMLFLLAPAFAPMLGGFVLISLGWRWIFTIVSCICVLGVILYMLRIPETQDPEKKQPINPVKIIKNYWSIITNFQSFLSLLIMGGIALVLFSWTALNSAILINDYGIEPEHFWMYSIIPVLFGIVTNKINGNLVRKYNPQQILVWATVVQVLFAAVNFVVAFWFLGPWGIVIAQISNSLFTGFQNGNNMSIFLLKYPHIVGTASSLILSCRVLIPAGLLYFVSHLPRENGVTFLYFDAAMILLTCSLVVLYNLLYPVAGAKIHALRVRTAKNTAIAAQSWK